MTPHAKAYDALRGPLAVLEAAIANRKDGIVLLSLNGALEVRAALLSFPFYQMAEEA